MGLVLPTKGLVQNCTQCPTTFPLRQMAPSITPPHFSPLHFLTTSSFSMAQLTLQCPRTAIGLNGTGRTNRTAPDRNQTVGTKPVIGRQLFFHIGLHGQTRTHQIPVSMCIVHSAYGGPKFVFFNIAQGEYCFSTAVGTRPFVLGCNG